MEFSIEKNSKDFVDKINSLGLPVKASLKEQYYIPDISDLRVGYECEVWGYSSENGNSYIKVKLPQGIKITQEYFIQSRIKTPFLTKEQIEAEGFVFKSRSIDYWFEKEGWFEIGNEKSPTPWRTNKIMIHYGLEHDHRLFVSVNDGGDQHSLFEGYCPSVNEFRQIMKMLINEA